MSTEERRAGRVVLAQVTDQLVRVEIRAVPELGRQVDRAPVLAAGTLALAVAAVLVVTVRERRLVAARMRLEAVVAAADRSRELGK